MRIGFAKDIHKLEEGKKLFLGGIEVPFEKGLASHSDGDVVLHSLCDAILGALNKGDIGIHFPPSDEKYKNKNSIYFLDNVTAIMRDSGFEIEYIDIFISCEKPKLKDYILLMREKIAKTIGISVDLVSIKAGTNEGFDSVGQGLAIESYASVLLKEKVNG